MPGERYGVDVGVRWSDQDAFGHVNNAVVVTLLEEARAALLFDAATRAGVSEFARGLLVAELTIRYLRPIPWTPRGVHVEMWAQDLRAAAFRVGYRLMVPAGPDGWSDAPAVDAVTQLVPYDLDAARPRRLSPDERAFVQRFLEP